MKAFKTVLLLGLLALVVGCGGPTAHQLKTDSRYYLQTFEKDISFTEAYRLARQWANNSTFNMSVGYAGWVIDSDLYEDEGYGEVIISYSTIGTAPSCYVVIDTINKDTDRTEVKFYHRLGFWKTQATLLEKYIDENRGIN